MVDTRALGKEEALLAILSEAERDIVDALLDQEPQPLGELRDEVAAYLIRLEREAELNDALDLEMAEEIVEAIRALIDHAAAEGDEEAHRLVHAAVHYFVMEEDVEADLDSLIGFDDDAEVINAVAYILGRPDLEIDL